MAVNGFCHIEFLSTDLNRSLQFFTAVFDWTFSTFSDGMITFGDGEKHLGGIQLSKPFQTGESPSVWVRVESIEAVLEKANAAGGTLLRGKTELPHVGWSAQISDPDGNPIGLVEFANR